MDTEKARGVCACGRNLHICFLSFPPFPKGKMNKLLTDGDCLLESKRRALQMERTLALSHPLKVTD